MSPSVRDVEQLEQQRARRGSSSEVAVHSDSASTPYLRGHNTPKVARSMDLAASGYGGLRIAVLIAMPSPAPRADSSGTSTGGGLPGLCIGTANISIQYR